MRKKGGVALSAGAGGSELPGSLMNTHHAERGVPMRICGGEREESVGQMRYSQGEAKHRSRPAS